MKYAPHRHDGRYAYVRTSRSWGKEDHRIVWAPSLSEAKREFGWTRQSHTTITVRRATPSDLDTFQEYHR